MPNTPVGLKIKNPMRRVKEIASLYPDGKNQMPKFSVNPNMSAPKMAPSTLLMPPMMAAVNPLMMSRVPIKGSRFCSMAISMPASPAIALPMKKLNDAIFVAEMPVMLARSGLSATARSCLPSVVFFNSIQRRVKMTSEVRMIVI